MTYCQSSFTIFPFHIWFYHALLGVRVYQKQPLYLHKVAYRMLLWTPFVRLYLVLLYIIHQIASGIAFQTLELASHRPFITNPCRSSHVSLGIVNFRPKIVKNMSHNSVIILQYIKRWVCIFLREYTKLDLAFCSLSERML